MAHDAAGNVLTGIPVGDHQAVLVMVQQARATIHGAYEQLQHTEVLAAHIEHQLGLERHWEIGGNEYHQFKEEAMLLKYHVALDELERLVVIVTIFLLFHNLLLLVCSLRVHILFGMCRYDYVSLLLVVHPFHSHMFVV